MVCYGFKDGYFIIFERNNTYTQKNWKSMEISACITLVCTNNFILQKDIKAQKRAWLIIY